MPKTRVLCVGCEVFARQIYLHAATSDRYSVDVVLLPRELHNHPQVLRRLIQEQIDSASQYQNEAENTAGKDVEDLCKPQGTRKRRGRGRGRGMGRIAAPRMGPYSLVLVAYGACGGGTVGLVCRGVPVVVLNRDDCASVLLGSCMARAEECKKCPGTWYCHRGDVERRMLGGNLHEVQGIFGPSAAPSKVAAAQGNEDFLHEEMERVIRSYSRLLYIKTSDEGDEEEEKDEVEWAHRQAAANGWAFEVTRGTNELLKGLLGRDWPTSPAPPAGQALSACDPGEPDERPDGHSDFVVMTKSNEEITLVQDGDKMVLKVKSLGV